MELLPVHRQLTIVLTENVRTQDTDTWLMVIGINHKR